MLTPESVKAYLKKNWNKNVRSVVKTARGLATPVYKVVAESQTYYFRVLQAKRSALLEKSLHDQLKSHDIPAPEIVHHADFVEDFENRSIVLITEIPGQQVTIEELKVDKELLRQVAENLHKINQIKVKGAGWIETLDASGQPVGNTQNYSDYMTHELENQFSYLLDKNILDKKQVSKIRSYVDANISLLDKTETVLTHGDLYTDHIFHQGPHFTGFIDFSDAVGASPFFDVVRFRVMTPEDTTFFEEVYFSQLKPTESDKHQINLEGILRATRKLWWRHKYNALTMEKTISAFDFYFDQLSA